MPLQEVAKVLNIPRTLRTPESIKKVIREAEKSSLLKIEYPGRTTYLRPMEAATFNHEEGTVTFRLGPTFLQYIKRMPFTMVAFSHLLRLSSTKASLLYLVVCHLSRMRFKKILYLDELRERLGFSKRSEPRQIMQAIERGSSHLHVHLPEQQFDYDPVYQKGRLVGVEFGHIYTRPSYTTPRFFQCKSKN